MKIRWLASFPKSGNTWVRLFLNSYLTGGNNPDNLCRAAAISDLKIYDYQLVCPIAIKDMDPYSVFDLRGAVLEHIRRREPWGLCKTHHANLRFLGVDLIPDRITERAIYLVRDPRDVASSFARHIGKEVDETIEIMSKIEAVSQKSECPSLVHLVSSWSQHVNSWMSAKFPVLCVKYENMLADPVRQFSNMLEFCGKEVDEDRVSESVEKVSIENMRAYEAKHGFREAKNGLFFGDTGGWREKLTSEQVSRIEADHGTVMRAMGYLEDEEARSAGGRSGPDHQRSKGSARSGEGQPEQPSALAQASQIRGNA